MYFRISSTGFDWYACIFGFLKRHETAIATVAIVRDEESTGMRNYVYALPDGRRYDKLPLDIFWRTEKHSLTQVVMAAVFLADSRAALLQVSGEEYSGLFKTASCVCP